MHSSKKNSPLASSTEFSRFSQILPMPKSTTWPKTSHGYLKPGKSSTLVTLEQKLLKKIAMLKQSSTEMRFWQFWIESKVITYVRYGMIQPDGRLKERAVQKQHHSNGTDARSFIENLIDKKIKSGYEGWMSDVTREFAEFDPATPIAKGAYADVSYCTWESKPIKPPFKNPSRDPTLAGEIADGKRECFVEIFSTELSLPSHPLNFSYAQLYGKCWSERLTIINVQQEFDEDLEISNFTEVCIASKQGDESQHDSGFSYHDGEKRQSNWETLKCYQAAAEQGVEQSNEEAVKWYRAAAEKGNATSQKNLANMYLDGQGVEQSNEEAVKWFRAAAKQDHVTSQYNLANKSGQYAFERTEEEAVKCYRAAAEQDYAIAQYNLIKWYQCAAHKISKIVNVVGLVELLVPYKESLQKFLYRCSKMSNLQEKQDPNRQPSLDAHSPEHFQGVDRDEETPIDGCKPMPRKSALATFVGEVLTSSLLPSRQTRPSSHIAEKTVPNPP
ncbi:hypothetical protein G9A89_002847 [Geosiphon pyriformis]|nr:hypothetical protein G9A89_002847 [Geosiphon pyriformis]